MKETDVNAFYIKAFEALIRNSVCADFSEECTVLYDEHFLKYLPSFIALCNERRMNTSYIFLPDSYQCTIQKNAKFYIDGEIQLPLGMRTAIGSSRIVLNFLTGSSESSKVRGAVLNNINGNGCKIIHCPNLSDDILNITSISDFKGVHKDCELISWALGNSSEAILKTIAPNGEEFTLSIPLGDWDNEPFISGGIIAENSWGNAVPGEAFWCPFSSNNINGEVCITGSSPGFLFQPGEYLYLKFENGKVVHYKPSENSNASRYLEKLFREIEEFQDGGWNEFAELGIGLNPAIKSLTGNSLFDEKMAGTVHIAIGDNVCFGHNIQSHIHHDLVIKQPTLVLDGKIIIDKGVIDLQAVEHWRKYFDPPALSLREDSLILFLPAKVNIESGYIRRVLNKGKRIGHIGIDLKCNENMITFLMRFLEESEDDMIYYSALVKELKNQVELKDIKRAVETFVHYKMASLENYEK
jgi:hypothetical protein